MPRRLEMVDKGVELMAYLSLHGDASQDQIAGALWPRKSLQRGRQLLDEVVAEVNRVVARATGSPTPAIAAQGRSPGQIWLAGLPGFSCASWPRSLRGGLRPG